MRLGHDINTCRSQGSRPHQTDPWSRAALALVVALLLLPLACTRTPPPESDPGGAVAPIAPAWTYRKPESPQTLYGLARVPMGATEESTQEVAVRVALDDLMVAYKGDVRRWALTEGGDAARIHLEALWGEIVWDQAEARVAEVAGLERYDDPARARVWLLASLDRSQVKSLLTAERSDVEPRAREALQRGVAAKARGDLKSELESYARSLSFLSGPVGLVIPGSAPNTLLRRDVEKALLGALSPVQLTRIKGPDSVRPGGTKISLIVEAAGPAGPISLPVVFEVTQGEATLAEPTGPDNKGRSQTLLTEISPESQALVIRAIPDIGRLAGGTEIHRTMLQKAAASWALPEARFPIEVVPLELLLTYIERGGTGGERGTLLMSELSEALGDAGARPTNPGVQALVNPELFQRINGSTKRVDPNEAPGVDLVGVARITLTSRQVEESAPPLHSAEGEGTFYLFDLRSQRMVAVVSTGAIRFTGFSQVDAERGFFLQTSDRLRDLVLRALVEEPLLSR